MSSIPQFPFVIASVRTDSGPAWLVCDSTDQVVATCFDEATAGFVAAKLNNSHPERRVAESKDTREIDLRVARAFVSTMLASFRVSLEADLSAPLPGIELDAAVLLADLAQWFGLNTGETAIACGPDVLGYVARLEGEAPSLVQVA